MLALADDGDRDRRDDSCAIVLGILRDTAYRLRRIVDEECRLHRQRGCWDIEGSDGSGVPVARDAARRQE
jgi:hypothetical protein